MTLRERFLAWWYVPTIEARQAQMLRDVCRRWQLGTVRSFHFKGIGVSVVNGCGVVYVTVPTGSGSGGEGGNWSAYSGNGGRGGGGPHDGKTHQIDFSKGKFIW